MITVLRFLCLFGILPLFAQTITTSNFEINDQQVQFDFTIEQKHSERERYQLKIYHSANNYTEAIPYQLNELVPNKSYTASFDGGNQIGSFDGQLMFRFEIEATRFPVELSDAPKSLKIGKNTNISWFDYHEEGPYDVKLYQGQIEKTTLAEGLESTSYSGKIPKSLEKGNYSIQVIPRGRSELISDKIPVLLKKGLNPLLIGGGVLLTGGIVGLAASGGGGEGGSEVFADPPNPPDGN
ncbi:hypothetical protein [Ekhidna sp.]|uniref:hypothetical protein n=1 Tax=Ekhidna sp. TaxID=2608089 RepID=UPI003CCBDC63